MFDDFDQPIEIKREPPPTIHDEIRSYLIDFVIAVFFCCLIALMCVATYLHIIQMIPK